MRPSTESPSRSGALALAGAMFFAFLLSTSRERPWSDATPIWEVADSLVAHGTIDIATPWPPAQPRGRGGKIYAIAPILQSLVHVPGAAILSLIARVAPRATGLYWPLASHLAPAALGALACALFFLIARRLALSKAAAALAAVALGLATTVWVYARSPYSEILQAACFTGFFGQLLVARARPGWRTAAVLGVWAGLLLNAKLVYLVCLPGALLFLAWPLRRDRRALAEVVGAAAAGMAPLLALILAYNQARWGGPLATGYGSPTGGGTGERLIYGLWGQLLSPGKSVFLYSPALLLALAGVPATRRRCPELLWLMLATVAPVVLFTGTLQFWAGDYAWGPRYLVFAVPVLLLPGAVLLDGLLAAPRGWRWRGQVAVVAVILAGGMWVQLMGNAFFWDHFIRIQREARQRWLGTANTTGTPFPDFGGVCGACFEDMHGMQWLPPFQPIEGHWWLLRHVPAGDNWMVAERDAPWRRYTKLQLNIAGTYAAARLDWWYLEFATPVNRIPGVLLLTVFGLGLLTSSALLVRRVRQAGLAAET